MAELDRIEWRGGFPHRAFGRLGWYTVLAGGVNLVGYVLFGSEPAQLDSGQRNMAALVPAVLAVLGVIGALPFLLSVVRRPIVSADHYALTVRPGALRTLLLPWARIVAIAGYMVREEPYLLVRCDRLGEPLGDSPGWWDQFALRAVARASRSGRGGLRLADYHVAVRIKDFAGDPRARFAALCALAPEHVLTYADWAE